MSSNLKKFMAVLLIVLGACILIGKLGSIFGWLISILVPVAFIVLGYLGLKNGRTILGTIILIIGLLSLVGKLSWLLGLAIAVGCVYYGYTMLRKRS